jgi:ABC-2 type transport system ATP-binding protein
LQAEAVLREETQLSDVQSFGDRVDVLIPDSDRGQEVVRRCLNQNNISVSAIEANEPTLENLFVTNLRASQSDPPLSPFPDIARKQ